MLELVVQGLSSAEIAKRMHRAVRTVESHRLALGKRLGARNRVELVRRAIQLGLVQVPSSGTLREFPGGAGPRHPDAPPSPCAERVLRFIDAGTACATGEDFIRTVVSHLALAFAAPGAFVARLTESGRLRSVAVWGDRGPLPPFEVPFATSPCAAVGRSEVRPIPVDFFPPVCTVSGKGWSEVKVVYVVALHGTNGARLGTLALGLREASPPDMLHETMLRVFAGRAAAELERMIMERELKQTQVRMANALRLARAGGWWCRPGSDEASWSEDTARLLGIETGAAASSLRTFLSRLKPGAEAQLRRGMEQLSNTGRVFCFETEVVGSADPTKVAVRGELRLDDSGEEIVEGTVRDISELRRAEREARANEKLASALMNSISASAAVVDRQGRIVAVNDAWVRRAEEMGWSDASIGCGYIPVCRRAVRGSSVAEVVAGIQGVLEGTSSAFSSRYTLGEPPSVRHIEIVATPLYPDAEAALVVHSDVTLARLAELTAGEAAEEIERRVAERTRELVDVTQRLREEAERSSRELRAYHDFFEHSRDLLCIADLAGTLKRVNPQTCRTLGFAEQELLGGNYMRLFHADEHHRVASLLSRLSAGHGVDEVALRMVKADGTCRWVAWSCAPPTGESGEIRPIGRDVTAWKTREEAVVRARGVIDEFLRPLDV